MTPLLTAVIPTRNRPDDLARAVSSVTSQEPAVALVVVDEGSTPPVDSSQLPHDALLVRHNVARGPSAARNAGAAAAETDWVAYLDDDDIWLPSKTRRVHEAIGMFPNVDLVFHRTSRRPRQKQGALRLIENPLDQVLTTQPPHLSGVAVRRTAHNASPFDEGFWATQDLDYLLRMAIDTKWALIDQDLSAHPGASDPSAITLDARIEGRLRFFEKHRQFIESDPHRMAFHTVRLGHLYRRAGRTKLARTTFKDALRTDPTSGLAWRGLIRSMTPSTRALSPSKS